MITRIDRSRMRACRHAALVIADPFRPHVGSQGRLYNATHGESSGARPGSGYNLAAGRDQARVTHGISFTTGAVINLQVKHLLR
jgi:hypothetical protein